MTAVMSTEHWTLPFQYGIFLSMNKLTSTGFFFLAVGIFTSVTILSVYQVLLTVPIAYSLFSIFKEKKFKLPLSAWLLLAFTLVALASLIINFDLIPKPSKNFGRVKYFIFGISGIFILREWIKETTEKTKRFLLNSFFVSMIVAGIYLVYVSYGLPPGHRPRGLTDTMRYGYGTAMIVLPLLSALLHLDKTKKWFDPRLLVGAIFFGLLGIYLTQTRGAFLGLICGLPFVLYYYKPKIGLIIGAIALAAVICLGGLYLFGSGNYNNRLLMNKNNKSDTIRRSQWQAAIIATKEKPIFGWGLSNFHSQLKRIKIENDLEEKDYDDAHSHNLFLEVASGTGLVGLFFFVSWVLTWAYEATKTKGLMPALIIPFGVAFVVSSQFEVTFDANNASMIFFLYSFTYVE